MICAEGFEPVRDAFEANFVDPGELGAGVAVVVDGQPVVDLWGGLADAHTERAWAEDTPVLVYSATKGPTATCALLLWEQGLLDLDAPVAEVWPEFAAAGKGGGHHPPPAHPPGRPARFRPADHLHRVPRP